ncbi:Subtilisin-like protease [Vigna angularis]|uniref:Subtilisin-like protease n=1 Tax=Phaseolus angularis TaxID=3914 RepID=A0A8T0KGX5_PHAAN|nr:Subtilisin-like protease [Vigna angularis]
MVDAPWWNRRKRNRDGVSGVGASPSGVGSGRLCVEEEGVTAGNGVDGGVSRTWGMECSVPCVFDTGIWPERQSFSGRDLGPVPAKWKGECVAGKSFPATSCNRKIIGARYFSEGYEATNGNLNETVEFSSARDSNGHDTHTTSIAAGRYVSSASTLGYAKGFVAGMAPKALLVVYKVCWLGECYGSDILAAFDAAVDDDVDVVSLSVGGVVVSYHLNEIVIGAFGATSAGIFVSSSTSNGGHGGLTVTNVAPWVTTVDH